MNSEFHQDKVDDKWLTLSEASGHGPYSSDYLRLLARHRKIQARKIDDVWYTTESSVNDYLNRQRIRTETQNENYNAIKPSEIAYVTGKSKNYFKKFIAVFLVLVVISAGIFILRQTGPTLISVTGEKLENISDPFIYQVAALPLSRELGNFFDAITIGFLDIWHRLFDNLFFSTPPIVVTYNTPPLNPTPQLIYTTPEIPAPLYSTPSTTTSPPVVVINNPTQVINVQSVKSELKIELEAYIRDRISSLTSPSSQPVIIQSPSGSIDLQAFKNNIILPEVRTLITNQSDSDASRFSTSITQLSDLIGSKQNTLISGTNIKTINGTSILGSGDIVTSVGGGTWGTITGTLSSQSDLQNALDAKANALGADDNYVTDAQLTVIGNTSGSNTGDNAANTQYSGLAASKQDTLVSGTNIKTLNSTSLLGSGDIVISGSDATKLAILNNLSDLNNVVTARTNLGLGTLATQSGTFSGTSSGTNTGDQTSVTGNAGTATALQTPRTIAGTSFNGTANIALSNKFIVQGTADAGLSGSQFLGALGTGIVKNTTTTGVLSIAVAGDFPTLNQNTTGSAATVTTAAQPAITSVGTLTGLTVTNPIVGSVTGSSGSTTGNAASASTVPCAGVTGNAVGCSDVYVNTTGDTMSGDLTFSNGRKGLVGVYDAAQTQAIFAMGTSYVLTNGGASSNIGNFYGIGWSYNPDYGGAGNNPQSKAGLNHQALFMNAGVTQTAIGTGVWTTGTITGLSALSIAGTANITGTITSPEFITGAGLMRLNTNQAYCNSGADCHFNLSGSGITYVGNTTSGVRTTFLRQPAGNYIYPGSSSGTDYQASYYLYSNSTWGLQTNTSFNSTGLYDNGNRVCSASNNPCAISITGSAASATSAGTVPASGVSAGTFPPGQFLFPSNVGIGAASAAGNVLLVGSASVEAGRTSTLIHGVLGVGQVANAISVYDVGANNEYFLQMLTNGDTDNEFLFKTDGSALADTSWTGGGADVAEWTPTGDASLEPGDVLVIDGSSSNRLVKKSTAGGGEVVVGVVSTNPGLVAGGGSLNSNLDLANPDNVHANDTLVALSGRVPVKISDENGFVQPGDRLTASVTRPGYAMKMTESGQSIGIALEDSNQAIGNGTGRILVFMNLGYHKPDSIVAGLAGEADDKLCINDTCVTESQLQTLLENAGMTSSSPAPEPEPAPEPTPEPIITPEPTLESTTTPTSTPPVSEPVSETDTTSPVITLTGSDTLNLNIGDIYSEEGAVATDDTDSLVTVVIDGAVDSNATGTYYIRYTATDSAGNEADNVTRTVNVGGSVPGFPETGVLAAVKNYPLYFMIFAGLIIFISTYITWVIGRRKIMPADKKAQETGIPPGEQKDDLRDNNI